MLRRSAADVAKAVPGSVMLVGDLSYKQGGAIGGHRSHQSGRDADIAFYVRYAKDRPVVRPTFVAFDGEGRARDGSGLTFDDRRNWLLVQSWARDRRAGLSHIFVSAPLRKRLLAFANRHPEFRKYRGEAVALLKQPEVGEDHSDHFHVRISCPSRQAEICREQSH
jgi:penicillin-insensitive murein endopeptidase